MIAAFPPNDRLSPKDKEVIMKQERMKQERWKRAFAKNDKDFKELFGVKKEIFLQMHAILTIDYAERRRKGGPRPTHSIGDQLFLTLQYWREYRTMAHLAFDFGIAKSTVSDTIRRVEDVLIKDGTFRLQGKKALLSEENAGRKFIVDVTESPVERPVKKRTKEALFWQEKATHDKHTDFCRRPNAGDHLDGSGKGGSP
jgi:predicted DNA-binding protein YlxM (UPF0122 family)